jgi:hypothetical protein
MIKPRPIVLAVIAIILALGGATAAYASPRGGRGTTAGPTVSLAAAARGCGVVHIALHGTKSPTITCLSRTRPALPARLTGNTRTPDTSGVACGHGDNLDIWAASAVYCYSGSGYLGLNPDIYNAYAAAAVYKSWVRLYDNGAGSYFNLAPGGYVEEFQYVKITQVCDDCGYHS